MRDPIDLFTVDLFGSGLHCPICQSLLAVPRTGRPPVFCSNACKMKAYRQRAALRNPLAVGQPVTKPLPVHP